MPSSHPSFRAALGAIVVAVALMFAAPSPSHAQPLAPTHGVVRAAAGLRSGPGASFSILGQLRPGQTLNVLRRTRSGDWLFVRSDAGAGWLPASSVTTTFARARLRLYAK